MATQNSSLIGANLGGNSDGATALFGVGSIAKGTDDTEWVYVFAEDALVTGQVVTLTTTYTAQLATVTEAIEGRDLAFAQGTFTASDYGWVAKRGNPIYVMISGVSTVAGPLFIADNSGTLTVASSGTVAGISMIQVTATATARALPAYVTYPRMIVLTGGGRG